MKRVKVSAIFLAAFFSLVLMPFSDAATINAASCSYQDVQAAVTASQSGDTVLVPAGSCTWSSQLVITKGIYLIGAGIGNTIIRGDITNQNGGIISYEPASPVLNEQFRVTGFTLDAANKSNGIWVANPSTTINNQIRIDHNKIINPGGVSAGRAIYAIGTVYGVIDNNVFELYGPGSIAFEPLGLNDESWEHLSRDFGNRNNMYFEDNTVMAHDAFHATGHGGRYVLRYNNYSGSSQTMSGFYPIFDMHGNQPGQLYSTMVGEIYGNKINLGTLNGDLLDQRGGQALVFYNKIMTTGSIYAQLREEYNDSIDGANYVQHVTNSYYWNNRVNGISLFGTGVPTEHAGTATGGGKNYIDITGFFTTSDTRYGVVIYGGTGAGQARRVINATPTRLTAEINWTIIPDNTSQYRVVYDCCDALHENSEYYNHNTSFDGTAGVGCGPPASRPLTCTPEVAYWATDQSCSSVADANVGTNSAAPLSGTLYKCTAPNTWTAYYTLYTYPHPLRTDCVNYPGLCDSSAATITVGPDNCSAAAVNAAIAEASEGGTIQLTCTGTVTWDSQVNLNGGKILKGPGIKSQDPDMNGTWPLVINSTASGIIIDITNAANHEVNRVTGLKFIGGSGATFGIASTGAGTGKDGNGAFRIDNNYFDAVDVDSRLLWLDGDEGKLTGLVDHNVLYHTYTNGYAEVFVGQDWKGASPTCYGYDSRTRPFVFGGSDFIFFEDNYFFNGFIETSGGGGRYVVRYNIFDSSSTHNDFLGVDGHGTDTGGWHCVGVVGVEMYNNNITGVGTISYSQVADARGGKWMIYNNNAQSGRLQLNEYRALGLENYPTGGSCMSLDFNECDGAACCEAPCGTYNIQCPTDQDIDKCWPLPNQVSNTFLWNNLKNGNYMPPSVVQTGYVKNYIVKNRDYWEPSYGLESALPSTCTADGNTFYGTTDSDKLFKCTSNNQWSLQYTPYAYPHPLASCSSPPQPVPGDVNGDGVVNINDLSFVGGHFGQKNTHPLWSAAADTVANNEIDIYDVVFIASRFT